MALPLLPLHLTVSSVSRIEGYPDRIEGRQKFELKSEIEEGKFLIVGMQFAQVARKGAVFNTEQNRTDARLSVIFDSESESGMLMWSLQKALTKDLDGKRIADRIAGTLF